MALSPRSAASPWPFVGMAGLASVLFLYVASALFLPWWGVLLLILAWVGLFVVACAWWTPRPTWVPAVAVIALLIWVAAVVSAGLGAT